MFHADESHPKFWIPIRLTLEYFTTKANATAGMMMVNDILTLSVEYVEITGGSRDRFHPASKIHLRTVREDYEFTSPR